MFPKQICYPNLNYINSKYGFFLVCLKYIFPKSNSHLGYFQQLKVQQKSIYFRHSILILSAGNILLCPR